MLLSAIPSTGSGSSTLTHKQYCEAHATVLVGVVFLIRFFTTEFGDKVKVAEAENQVQVRPCRPSLLRG